MRISVKRHIGQKLCSRRRTIKGGDIRQLLLFGPLAQSLIHAVQEEACESQTFVQRAKALLQESEHGLLHDAKCASAHLRLHIPESVAHERRLYTLDAHLLLAKKEQMLRERAGERQGARGRTIEQVRHSRVKRASLRQVSFPHVLLQEAEPVRLKKRTGIIFPMLHIIGAISTPLERLKNAATNPPIRNSPIQRIMLFIQRDCPVTAALRAADPAITEKLCHAGRAQGVEELLFFRRHGSSRGARRRCHRRR